MARSTDGAGPKPFSLAPMRAFTVRPRLRSIVSGPTKGTVEGSDCLSGVRRDNVDIRNPAEKPAPQNRFARAQSLVAAVRSALRPVRALPRGGRRFRNPTDHT